jgi:hypothetical protein
MPVRRLHSLREAEDDIWRDTSDPRFWSSLASWWALSDRLFPWKLRPGLYKHRSIEDLNRQRESWEAEAIEAGNTAPTHPLDR